MKKIAFLFSTLTCFAFTTTVSGQLPKTNEGSIAEITDGHDLTPGFLPNNGQISSTGNDVVYAQVDIDHRMRTYITGNGLTFFFMTDASSPVKKGKLNKSITEKFERLNMNLEGADIKSDRIEWSDPISEQTYNYFLGDKKILDQNKFQKLTIRSVYPGIDWVLYFDANKKFKYDFIVHPNGDASSIKIHYDGNGSVRLSDENKQLFVKTKSAEIREGELICYQQGINGDRTNVEATYAHQGKQICINAKYDHTKDLVIDPFLQLMWSTYAGGNSAQGDYFYACATDASNNLYVVGQSNSSNFPLFNAGGGSYYQTVSSLDDGIIMKFNTSRTLVWSTAFGGTIDHDEFDDISVDANGNLVVGGYTMSNNFPLLNGGGYYDNTLAGINGDAVFVKFTTAGVLLHSTYFGGDNEDAAFAIKSDALGNTYITGRTQSYTNFPLVNPGGGAYYQNTNHSTGAFVYDAYIAKFSSTQTLLWSTYVGSSKDDEAHDVEVNTSNDVYITGSACASTTFPLLNPGGGAYYNGTFGGISDIFLTQFNSSDVLLWSTLIGGTATDQGWHMKSDANSNLYLLSNNSIGGGVPIVNLPGAYNQSNPGGGAGDMLVMKFNSTRAMIWSTFLGGNGYDVAASINTDYNRNVYFIGYSSSTNFPTVNPGNNAYYDATYAGAASLGDIVVGRFNNNSNAMYWSTYYGGTGSDYSGDIAPNTCYIDAVGITQSTNCTLVNPGFGAFMQNTQGGGWDGLVLQFGLADPVADAGPNQTICLGQCAVIGTPSGGHITYSWSPATWLSATNVAQPTACPLVTTTYTLTTTSSNGCTTQDAVTVTVLYGANAGPDITLADPISCGPGNNSASIGSPVPFCNNCTYSWSPSTFLSSTTTCPTTVTYPGGAQSPITYTLTVTGGAPQCSTDVVTVTFVQCRMGNFDNLPENGSVSVYPNPSNGITEIKSLQENESLQSIEVFDLTGKLIYNTTCNPGTKDQTIDLSSKERGIYLIRITTTGGIFTKRITRI